MLKCISQSNMSWFFNTGLVHLIEFVDRAIKKQYTINEYFFLINKKLLLYS